MRTWAQKVALTAVLLIVACGSAGAGSPADGSVTGVVDIRACAGPPPPTDQPTCTTRPMAGVEVEISDGDRIVAKATTDARGRYTLRVDPGTYVVRIVTRPGDQTPDDSHSVRVETGKQVEVDFHMIFHAV